MRKETHRIFFDLVLMVTMIQLYIFHCKFSPIYFTSIGAIPEVVSFPESSQLIRWLLGRNRVLQFSEPLEGHSNPVSRE